MWPHLQRCARVPLLRLPSRVGVVVGGAAALLNLSSAAAPIDSLSATPPLAQEAALLQVDESMLAASQTNHWLLYAAIGLSLLNLVLIYLLYRSPSSSRAVSETMFDPLASSRTQKRLDKRKREVEDLQARLESIQKEVKTNSDARVDQSQIRELVRAIVREELMRQATSSSNKH